MIDPITALAAVSSAVNLVKKAVATVQDVQSLGPVLGKYFDAKAAAIEVVEKSKSGGFAGSAMGKALELEMALEQAREFEEQVKMLFFQSNKMDVWQRIVNRAQHMEVEAAHAARRKKEADKKRAEEMEEMITLVVGGVVAIASAGVIASLIYLKSIAATISSGLMSERSFHSGTLRDFAKRSHRALSTAPIPIWNTPVSGPSQRI